MIAKLKGTVDYRGEDFLIVDTGAIGYQVFVSQTTKSQALEEVILYTMQLIRNEQPVLVGFLSLQERCMFEILLNVQGVGLKMALSLMSVMTVSELAHAILNKEKKMLKNADGVGDKLAERIILELKNKIDPAMAILVEGAPTFNQDVIEILVSLGYPRFDALTYLKETMNDHPQVVKTEEMVKLILQKRVVR